MPIYEYRCDQGHTFEVMQRMSDDPVVSCQTCSAPVQRVFHPVAVHFKGSGFYNTDYGTRKRARERGESTETGKGDGGGTKSGEKSAAGKDASQKSDSTTSTAPSSAPKPKSTSSD